MHVHNEPANDANSEEKGIFLRRAGVLGEDHGLYDALMHFFLVACRGGRFSGFWKKSFLFLSAGGCLTYEVFFFFFWKVYALGNLAGE